jgi:hypothetical protein
MHKWICCIGLILLGISCERPVDSRNGRLMQQVYKSQQSCYNSVGDHSDYKAIVDFGKKRREMLYQHNGIQLSQLSDFIILEGYATGWGTYCGLLISPGGNYFYKNTALQKGMMEFTKVDKEDMSAKSGIRKSLIERLQSWDTAYINYRNRQLGHVSDGFAFMATRVQQTNGQRAKISTIAFDDFPE